ncbi:MAG: hypothetical protein WD802_07890 [Gemmatimonadaceae bacterium]
MHDLKRKNFEEAHPEVPFPQIDALSDDEARELRIRIARRLGCPEDDGLMLVRSLSARSVPVEGVNAESEHFKLLGTLWSLRLRPEQPTVYVNWYRFDQIDRVNLEELARYFGDLWYPSSDDIDIFDDTCDWILSVGHSGDVRIAQLGVRRTVGA